MKSCCAPPSPPGRPRGRRALVVGVVILAVATWAVVTDRARGEAKGHGRATPAAIIEP
jgi:hypothetical protein